MFQSLSGTQRFALFALFCLSLGFSYFYWTESRNSEVLLQHFPHWGSDGYVLYDGYGLYAEYLSNAMAHPGGESLQELKNFASDYIHSFRPGYPFLVALLNLLLSNIVLSSMIINVAAASGSFLLFLYMLQRHYNIEGTSLFYAGVVFISHVSMIGALARPMADSMALLILLLCFHLFLLCLEGKKFAPYLLILSILAAVLTKTVLILFCFALPLAFVPSLRQNHGARRRVLLLGIPTVLFSGCFLLILRAFFSDTMAAEFLFTVLRSTLSFPSDPDVIKVFVLSAMLFLAIAFQAYPLFISRNPFWRQPAFAIHAAWIAVYVLQRFVFFGFGLEHSRARYPLPIVPSILILAWPGIRRLIGERGEAFAAIGLAALNYAVWIVLLLRET